MPNDKAERLRVKLRLNVKWQSSKGEIQRPLMVTLTGIGVKYMILIKRSLLFKQERGPFGKTPESAYERSIER